MPLLIEEEMEAWEQVGGGDFVLMVTNGRTPLYPGPCLIPIGNPDQIQMRLYLQM